jgi:hypothetical protein
MSAGSVLSKDEDLTTPALLSPTFVDEKSFNDIGNDNKDEGIKVAEEEVGVLQNTEDKLELHEELHAVVKPGTESSQEDKEKAAKKIQNLFRKVVAVKRLFMQKQKVLKAQIDAAYLLDWCVRSIQKIIRIRQAKQKVKRLAAQRKVIPFSSTFSFFIVGLTYRLYWIIKSPLVQFDFNV